MNDKTEHRTAERVRRATAYSGSTEFADLYRPADQRLYQADGRDRAAMMEAA